MQIDSQKLQDDAYRQEVFNTLLRDYQDRIFRYCVTRMGEAQGEGIAQEGQKRPNTRWSSRRSSPPLPMAYSSYGRMNAFYSTYGIIKVYRPQKWLSWLASQKRRCANGSSVPYNGSGSSWRKRQQDRSIPR